MSLQDIDYVLTTTRAVRRRLDLDRPVDPEVILQCLRIAAQAPTGGNIQLWRFVVVTDPDLRAAIGEFYAKGAEDYLAAGAARATTDAQRRVSQSAIYLKDNIGRVPVLVLACQKGRPPVGENQAGFYGSIMPAVWSFALALRSRGLGSVWTTLHLAHEKEVADLLGIPDDVTQVALLPVAHTIGTDFKPAQRQPIERFTFFNRFGSRDMPSGDGAPDAPAMTK